MHDDLPTSPVREISICIVSQTSVIQDCSVYFLCLLPPPMERALLLIMCLIHVWNLEIETRLLLSLGQPRSIASPDGQRAPASKIWWRVGASARCLPAHAGSVLPHPPVPGGA
jgi:hypothetical protein